MRDLLGDYERLAAAGRPFGRAVVTSVWGSAPRPAGSSMLAAADGTMAGSLSGGCVESATAVEIGPPLETISTLPWCVVRAWSSACTTPASKRSKV